MNCVLNIRNCYTESIKTYVKRIQNISFPYTDFLQGYDLNIDHAPVLSIVTENEAGYGLPLAFGNYI